MARAEAGSVAAMASLAESGSLLRSEHEMSVVATAVGRIGPSDGSGPLSGPDGGAALMATVPATSRCCAARWLRAVVSLGNGFSIVRRNTVNRGWRSGKEKQGLSNAVSTRFSANS